LRLRARRAAAAFALASATSATLAAADPPGHIRFTAGNLVTTAHGEFRDWKVVRAEVDEAEPARSRIEVEISLASLDTGLGMRDDDLRGSDFFDVARFPTARVVLDGCTLDGEDAFRCNVTLELRGQHKTFPMRFQIEDRAARRIRGAVTLDRRDYGVGAASSRWNPLSIDDAVEVEVETTVPPSAGDGRP
jgi:polyisoprenoid-binding protein YceI